MKTINNILKIIALAGCFIFPYSCDDFLEKEPPGVASQTTMETPEGVEDLLIGAYSDLQGYGRFGGAMGTDWTYGSGASDDAYKGSSAGDQNNYNALERYECLPSNEYMRERWHDCYDGVARTNEVLKCLWATQESDHPMDADRAMEVEAEAKFLRAWYHFKANRVFEKIPYVKTETELGMPPEDVPNDTEGWDDLEADLQFAIDHLPETNPLGEVGRATKYSAMAVKAHAHLYQGEPGEAKPLLDAIINSGKYHLVRNYYDNYDMTTENNEESIFEIQCATSGTNFSSLVVAGPSMYQAGPAGIGWGFFQPSQNLFEAFQTTPEGLPVLDIADRDPIANDMGISSSEEFHPTDHFLDPRVDWTISRRGIDFLGWGICAGSSWIRAQSNGGPYMTKKFMHTKENASLNTNGSGFDNGQNFRAYRFAHILLWRAEIAVEDGELDYARQLVNQIRERAQNSKVVMGLCKTYILDGRNLDVDWNQPAANYNVEPYPAGSDVFSTQEKARKAVRLEERLEFATEGMRFFDLRRWGIANEVLNSYIAQDQKFRSFLKGAVYNPEEDDYWPIPQDQLNIQPVLIQDPAYK